MTPFQEQLRQYVSDSAEPFKELTINIATLTQLLVEKGLFTGDEFVRTKIRCTSMVDQLWSEITDRQVERFFEANPELEFLMRGMKEGDNGDNG